MTKKTKKKTREQINLEKMEAARIARERQDRFAWTGDEILYLKIDGQNIKSSPR